MPQNSLTTESTSSKRSAIRDFVFAAPAVVVATLLLWQLGDLIYAERLLQNAATAAAQEATLPQATPESVFAAVRRTAQESRLRDVVGQPLITVNDRPAVLHPLDLLQSGDRVEVTLSAEATDVVPDWFRSLGLSLAGRKLCVTAAVIKP